MKLEDEISTRLSAVMIAYGIKSRTELASLCETTGSVVNNWMLGYNMPRVPEMIRLCERTGVTLDWLYRGSLDAMDELLAVTLTDLVKGKKAG